MSDIVIRIEHVYKSFGEEEVLHDICHEFEAKQIHGIVGNNGSGKTVLMKCICGFMHPNSGTIYVDYEQVGKDVDFQKIWESS